MLKLKKGKMQKVSIFHKDKFFASFFLTLPRISRANFLCFLSMVWLSSSYYYFVKYFLIYYCHSNKACDKGNIKLIMCWCTSIEQEMRKCKLRCEQRYFYSWQMQNALVIFQTISITYHRPVSFLVFASLIMLILSYCLFEHVPHISNTRHIPA